MSAKVLIVEDEYDFREALVALLNLEGFDAYGVGTIEEHAQWIKKNHYDILILDRNLPDGDGLQILITQQKINGAGIIILSCEGQPHDRILGMNADADYYLVKPFPTDELLSILNRINRKLSTSQTSSEGEWILNSVSWEIKAPNHLEIELTRSEFALMRCFVDKPGIVMTRDQIITGLGFNPTVYDNRRLEVMLRRLRKKIEDSGVVKFPLQTVYGVGLAFNGKLISI